MAGTRRRLPTGEAKPAMHGSPEFRAQELRQAIYAIGVGAPIPVHLEDAFPGLTERAQRLWEQIDTSQKVLRAEATAVLYTEMGEAPSARERITAANSLISQAESSYAARRKWEQLNDPHTRRAAIEEFCAPSEDLLDVIAEAWTQLGEVPSSFRALLNTLQSRGVL